MSNVDRKTDKTKKEIVLKKLIKKNFFSEFIIIFTLFIYIKNYYFKGFKALLNNSALKIRN